MGLSPKTKGSVRLVTHGHAHGSVSLPGIAVPPAHGGILGIGEARENNGPMKGAMGSLGADRHGHRWLPRGRRLCLQMTRARTTSFRS